MDHGGEVICFFCWRREGGGILTTQPGDWAGVVLGNQDVSIGVRRLGGGVIWVNLQ